MKFNITILTIILLLSTLVSCKKDDISNEEIIITFSPNECWNEKEDETIIQFAGANHRFCFLNETEFTLELARWTDIVIDINTPTNWIEYVKGTYVWTNESFEISGFYMDSDYINFVASRSGATELSKTYLVNVVSETEMILDDNDNMPHRGIRLLK